MSSQIDHNLNVGDCITIGTGNPVYYVTDITDDFKVNSICVTPTSEEFGVRNTKHIVELGSGFKKIHYLGDILNEVKALKLVGMSLWRPVFFSCGMLNALEKMVIQRGWYTYNEKVQLIVQDNTVTVNQLFNDVSQCVQPTCVFGFWVDKNGYRPSDCSSEAIVCNLNGEELQDYTIASLNVMVRKINEPSAAFKKIRMCTPTGVMLSDETFIPNAHISEYVTMDGKRLMRTPLHK